MKLGSSYGPLVGATNGRACEEADMRKSVERITRAVQVWLVVPIWLCVGGCGAAPQPD